MSKKILITGCSTGFGFSAAKLLSKNGHHVFATMRDINGKNAAPTAELRNFAKSEGVDLEVHELDVTSNESVTTAISNIPEVDVLINNAGVAFLGPTEAFTPEELSTQLDVNIVGTFRVAKAVLPGMRARKSGLIIQISSIAGRGGFPSYGIYCASKWGLEGYTECLRYELAPFGIDVVIVEPGPFSTNIFGNFIYPKDEKTSSVYKHVEEYGNGMKEQIDTMLADENMPTDPNDVAEIFEKLITTPPGKRPFRTIAGIDFGFQSLNDAVEPIRKGILNEMGLSDWDGPRE